MVKFYKIKDTGIRKVKQGPDGIPLALIGKAGELVEKGILSTTDKAHDPDKWVIVPYVTSGHMELPLYDTLEEAKKHFM